MPHRWRHICGEFPRDMAGIKYWVQWNGMKGNDSITYVSNIVMYYWIPDRGGVRDVKNTVLISRNHNHVTKIISGSCDESFRKQHNSNCIVGQEYHEDYGVGLYWFMPVCNYPEYPNNISSGRWINIFYCHLTNLMHTWLFWGKNGHPYCFHMNNFDIFINILCTLYINVIC